ncbi:hypothetical protein GCM10010252_28500 [Streptomyces aureoverticillatus]|nr:hypothetical protein GCM10010252_28500 [Streptomyces aureoverticillatus]
MVHVSKIKRARDYARQKAEADTSRSEADVKKLADLDSAIRSAKGGPKSASTAMKIQALERERDSINSKLNKQKEEHDRSKAIYAVIADVLDQAL